MMQIIKNESLLLDRYFFSQLLLLLLLLLLLHVLLLLLPVQWYSRTAISVKTLSISPDSAAVFVVSALRHRMADLVAQFAYTKRTE